MTEATSQISDNNPSTLVPRVDGLAFQMSTITITNTSAVWLAFSLCAVASVSNSPTPCLLLDARTRKAPQFWRGEMVFGTGDFSRMHLGRKFPVVADLADKSNPGERPKLPWGRGACDKPKRTNDENCIVRSLSTHQFLMMNHTPSVQDWKLLHSIVLYCTCEDPQNCPSTRPALLVDPQLLFRAMTPVVRSREASATPNTSKQRKAALSSLALMANIAVFVIPGWISTGQ